MFQISHVESRSIHIARDGVEAVRARERLGLPEGTSGTVRVESEPIIDRRAAESWPEALNYAADLPDIGNDELQALWDAGVFVPIGGPEKMRRYAYSSPDDTTVGLRLGPTVSPFELAAWRRAWAAEQRAIKAEAKAKHNFERAAELEEQIKAMSPEPQDDV